MAIVEARKRSYYCIQDIALGDCGSITRYHIVVAIYTRNARYTLIIYVYMSIKEATTVRYNIVLAIYTLNIR